MVLTFKEVKKLENGNYERVYTTDNPKFNTVSYEYVGTEEDLTNFLKTLIFNYMRRHKLID